MTAPGGSNELVSMRIRGLDEATHMELLKHAALYDKTLNAVVKSILEEEVAEWQKGQRKQDAKAGKKNG